MVERNTIRLNRFLPQVAVATTLVVFVPSLVGWGLRYAGVVTSEVAAILVVVTLSLLLSCAGGTFWRSRSGSRDLLFSELMVWGWLRRWWKERRLATVVALLEGVESTSGTEGLSRERHGKLLVDLAHTLEARDPYTHGHSHRVARHAEMIGETLGLPHAEIAKIRTAAALHDVGKINTPVALLHKPARLTDAEFQLIQRHADDGAEMVAKLADPELTAMVRQHHERLDGTGYPAQLSGADICLGARIVAVADTFDAITSTRPYRSANAHQQALEILKAEAGTKLDAEVVDAFESYYWGRRPLALWVTLTNISGRLMSTLGGGSSATANSLSRVVAASALTSASAVAIVIPLLPLAEPASSAAAGGAGIKSGLEWQTNPLAWSSGPGGAVASSRGARRGNRSGRTRRQGPAAGEHLLVAARPGAGAAVAGPGRYRAARPGGGRRGGGGSTASTASPTVTTTPPTNTGSSTGDGWGRGGSGAEGSGNGHGNGNGNGNGNGQGNGNGNGNGQGNGNAQGGGGDGHGNGGGESQGHGGGQGDGGGGGNGQGHTLHG